MASPFQFAYLVSLSFSSIISLSVKKGIIKLAIITLLAMAWSPHKLNSWWPLSLYPRLPYNGLPHTSLTCVIYISLPSYFVLIQNKYSFVFTTLRMLDLRYEKWKCIEYINLAYLECLSNMIGFERKCFALMRMHHHLNEINWQL